MGWLNHRKPARLGAVALALGGSAAFAAEPTIEQLQEQIRQLQSQVTEIKGEQNWMEQRRSEELRSLVEDVIRDADSRSSAQSGKVAGHNKKFFLASEDGNFSLALDGQVQFRYIWNNIDDDTLADQNESGFQVRRAKLGFSGHVHDPALQYKIKAGFDRGNGNFSLEEAYMNYKLTDSMYVRAGQFKNRFLHEELTSSSKQLAVERSNVNEMFTLDYAQGVEVGAQEEKMAWAASWYGGRETDNTDFNGDFTEYAFAGRVDFLVAGNWKQFDDFQAWAGDAVGVKVGAGLDWEVGDQQSAADPIKDFMQWTVDLAFESDPVNAFVAVIGRNVNGDNGATDFEQLGIVGQVGVFIVPKKQDVFFRYEHMKYDGFQEVTTTTAVTVVPVGGEDEQDILTFGTNIYFQKHDSKLTIDVLIAPDGIYRGESGGGTLSQNNANNETQTAVRAQYQILF